MSALTKILLGILLLVFVALGVEAFLYFQVLSKPQQQASPTPISQVAPKLIDITGPVALVGFLNLFDITKEQVAEWAKANGPVEVPAYSGPLPTIPPNIPASISAQISPLPKLASVTVMAGYFRRAQATGIVISQGGKDTALSFNQSARLWIKQGSNIQIVPSLIGGLLAAGTLSQFASMNDLVLVPNINEASGGTNLTSFVVFK